MMASTTRISLIACLLFAICGTASADPDQSSDATDISSADVLGQMVMLTTESMRKLCDASMPESKDVIDYYAFAWTLDNSVELAAIQVFEEHEDRVLATAADATAAKLANSITEKAMAFPADRQRQACSGFVSHLKAGDANLASLYPKAASYLIDYSKVHPLSAIEYEDQEFKTGCLKASINKHFDYDVGLALCGCALDVVKTELTEKERAEVNEVASHGGDSNRLPQMVRIAPDVQKCGTSRPNP